MTRAVIHAVAILVLSALGLAGVTGRASAQDGDGIRLSPGGFAMQATPSETRSEFGGAPGLKAAGGGTTLTYFTPSLGHLSTNLAVTPRTNGEAGERSKDYVLGVGYGGRIGGVSIETATAFSGIRTESAPVALAAGGALTNFGGREAETALGWKGGISLGYDGFHIGGSYETKSGAALALGGNESGPQVKENKLTIGGVYNTGSLSFLMSMTQGEVDGSAGNGFAASTGLTDYHLGADYAVGAGVLLHAGIDYGATNFGPGFSAFTGDSPLRDLNSLAVRMGSTLKF